MQKLLYGLDWIIFSLGFFRWSLAALKELVPSLPARITIDVLRQAAKSCVVKREFQRASLLIRQAVYLAREVFDTDHPKYADVLIDYGFYLLNYDSIVNSVSVYTVNKKNNNNFQNRSRCFLLFIICLRKIFHQFLLPPDANKFCPYFHVSAQILKKKHKNQFYTEKSRWKQQNVWEKTFNFFSCRLH